MKKNTLVKLITMALIAALMAAAVCGCGSVAEATEASVTEEPDPASEESVASSKDYAEWTLDEIATFGDIVSGITDHEYAAGEGANYVIYEDVQYDDAIIGTVLFDTASVRFDTVGEYDMTYWIYFDMSALAGWMADTGMEETYAGLDSNADILAVSVHAAVTVTEAVEEDEAAEEVEEADSDSVITAGASGNTSSESSASTSSQSCNHSWNTVYSASSKGNVLICSKCGAVKQVSSSKSCNHNWVEQGYYENVPVSKVYGCKCKVCGYTTTDDTEMSRHVISEHDNEASWTVTLISSTYDQVWHTTGYKCSKCGATK